MVTLLCILLALVTFLMGMAILVQEPKQSGLSGSFGMGGEQMLGAGKPNALSKFTGVLAGLFILLSMGVVLLDKQVQQSTSIEERAGDASGELPPAVGTDPTTGGTAPPPPPPGGEGGG